MYMYTYIHISFHFSFDCDHSLARALVPHFICIYIYIYTYTYVPTPTGWASFANLAAALKGKLGKDVSHHLKSLVVCLCVPVCGRERIIHIQMQLSTSSLSRSLCLGFRL